MPQVILDLLVTVSGGSKTEIANAPAGMSFPAGTTYKMFAGGDVSTSTTGENFSVTVDGTTQRSGLTVGTNTSMYGVDEGSNARDTTGGTHTPPASIVGKPAFNVTVNAGSGMNTAYDVGPGDAAAYTSDIKNGYLRVLIVFIFNNAPAVPTNVQRTSDNLDTTPAFTCNIVDDSATVKARYEIFNAPGQVVGSSVGTVDSAFLNPQSGAPTFPAEFASALAPGSYAVRARGIDVEGLLGNWSGYTYFDVTQNVDPVDRTLLWNSAGSVTKDIPILWNVEESNRKSYTLLWQVNRLCDPVDLTLKWDVLTPWEPVNEGSTVWEEV